MPTLIDTGSTLSYIREDLVAIIGQQFGATIDGYGNYIVDCKYRDMPGTIDFGFNRGRMVINVRYKDFIFQQYPGHCMLGVQPADVGSTNYVLGDTFIRGAYCEFFFSLLILFLLTFAPFWPWLPLSIADNLEVTLTYDRSGIRPAIRRDLDEPVLQLRRRGRDGGTDGEGHPVH